MSKKIAIIWLSLMSVACLILLVNATLVKNVRHRDTKAFRADKVEDWEVSYEEEPNEDGLYVISYKNTIDKIQPGGEVLMFYAYHGDVYAYADGDILYSLVLDKSDTFLSTVSGDTWNCFLIPQAYEGKEIEVLIETQYASYLEYEPDFYLGDRLNIVREEMQRGWVSILLSIAIFVVGIVLLVYSWLTARNHYDSYDLVYLGIFAILLSVWFIINMPVLNMVIDIGTILTYLSYLILGSISVPLILFEKRLVAEKFKRACDMLCVIIIAVQVVSVGLQLTGIKDMKESLLMTHISLGVCIVGLISVLVRNVVYTGMKNINTMGKINILCGIITAAGVAMDIVHYYLDPNGGKNYEFTKCAFLIYTIALCYYSIRETERLMKKGKEAQKLEELAYRDELTGVYNRTACNDYMRKLDLNDGTYTVIMFDLNNLKQCNDSLGHNYGDDYIISSAKYIQHAFEQMGECYRIGGDEFCIIGKNVSEEKIQTCYQVLEKYVEAYNVRQPEVRMSIAYGHMKYNPEVDEDLKDTRGRADKAMYKHKMEMKAKK